MPTRTTLTSALSVSAAVLLALVASGCAGLGPSVITNGRGQYNEAITRTTSQQTLSAIVRMRYGETYGMLAVTSVTANMSLKTNAQFEAGFGPDSNFSGNIVPFSGGVVYEENPTITYAPVEGSKYLRQYLSPIPLELVVLSARSSRFSSAVLSLLIERINGIWNPASGPARAAGGGDQFVRAMQLLETLRARGELDWVQTDKPESFALLLRLRKPGPSAAGAGMPDTSPEMQELITLLRIDTSTSTPGRVVLPLRLCTMEDSRTVIDISTRSVFELLELAASGVEVPAADEAAGLAPPGWGTGTSAIPVRVRYSPSPVPTAAVQVPHGNGWFYIDATDHESKAAFGIIQTLLVSQTRSTNDGLLAPVLTVPVSK